MNRWASCVRNALAASLLLLSIPIDVRAQDFDQTSCDEFLLQKRQVKGKAVGPASCLMQETDITLGGRSFRRLDIGLDGTVEGYVTKTGDYKEYLTNAPDLVFPQTADPGPTFFAVAAY